MHYKNIFLFRDTEHTNVPLSSHHQAIFAIPSIAKSSMQLCYVCGFAQSGMTNPTYTRERNMVYGYVPCLLVVFIVEIFEPAISAFSFLPAIVSKKV
jgi:hypothetical protein